MDDVRVSKRLSYVLRHRPDSVGLILDDGGWVDVEAGTRIRASQGHSVPVELGYAAEIPLPTLFHGTPVRNVPAIVAGGLRAGRRHAVHLSPDVATARRVGERPVTRDRRSRGHQPPMTTSPPMSMCGIRP